MKHLGPVHTTPKEFESGGFILKTHQMFSVHTTPEKFENATITGHFGFVFEENSVMEITWLSWRHRFPKTSFLKCFPSALKRKAGVFKFLQFEECFRKAPFSWWLSVDSRPNRRNKAAFSNTSSVVWTGPQKLHCDVTARMLKYFFFNICFAVSPCLYRMTHSGPVRNLSLQAVHTETSLKFRYKRYIGICTTQPWDNLSIKRTTGLCQMQAFRADNRNWTGD